MVCGACGYYNALLVDKSSQSARCMSCGHVEPMRIVPLFIVTGASGAGKTVVVAELRRLMPDWDVFETDIMWGADWQQVKNNWLRIAHSIAQSGRGTLLCGTMLPEDVDRCDHRDRFSQVYYLNLHCNDAARDARLRARPGWRGCTEEFIAEHRRFAQWLLDNAATAFDPPMITVDTTNAPVSAVAGQIRDWARERWALEGSRQ
jgi:hypothetical protein